MIVLKDRVNSWSAVYTQATMDIDSYLATSGLPPGRSSDFPTTADPAAALSDAKKWLEATVRHHFQKNPADFSDEQQDAGNILATGPDGPAGEPTATLFAKAINGKLVLDWNE